MKNKTGFVFLGFLCLILWSGMLSAQTTPEPATKFIYDFIPQTSDLVMLVQPDILFRHPALTRIQESGDFKRLKKDLAIFPWKTPPNKTYPDVLFTFFFDSRNYSMLLDTGKNIEQMYQDLAKKYAGQANVKIQKGRKNQFHLIRLIFLRPEKKDGDRCYDLVYLADHIAVYTNYRNQMQWQQWGSSNYSAAYAVKLKDFKDQDIVMGFSGNPGKFFLDPTGVLRRLKYFDFYFSSSDQQSISLLCTAHCKSENKQDVARVATQIHSYLKILLVIFFGADQELFKALSDNCKVLTGGNMIRIKTELDTATLNAIRNYYQKHTEEMNRGAQQQFSK